jgi:hypothetical protein
MSRTLTIRMTSFVVLIALAFVRGAAAQDAAGTVQPRAHGLLTAMSAEEQTRLALSAAPPEVSGRASVYVLAARGGYTQVRAGSNGFSCLVERALLETVEPVCYDAEGSATTLRARFYREELRAQGLPEDEVTRRIEAAYADGRLSAPRKPGVVYMLSPEQRSWNPFTREVWTAPPHFMLYSPYATQADMGGPPGLSTPVIDRPGKPDALMIIMAPGTHGH